MTFDQLTTVRHDKIVNEEIVFRALWQREALERIIFPFHFQSSQPIPSGENRNKALNEYFDVDDTVDQERRRRILLGTPRFRFRESIHITPPTLDNGSRHLQHRQTYFRYHISTYTVIPKRRRIFTGQTSSWPSYSKTFYSRPEKILGSSYCVAVEAQEDANEKNVLVCRFELRHVNHKLSRQDLSEIEPERLDNIRSQRANIRYSIYCLNAHENLAEDQKVDQEDRVLVPVTESAELLEENNDKSGCISQTIIDADISQGVTIDVTVALEVFGFTNV
ncbi:hypothetical protein CLU79DRAFT_702407 [Phycomyces nitens]|nr:hypothetical protein CLU79DRAFT_702407 [Phycomyces nitens]